MEKETIKIKYHSEEIDKLTYIDGKSDWIDLRASEHVVMKKGEFHLIKLGISMQLPKGYEAVIVPRSSTFKNWKVVQANMMGVIDNSYKGDEDVWGAPVFATRDTLIPFDTRVFQFRILENQPRLTIDIVDNLNNEARGGFGSTGTM